MIKEFSIEIDSDVFVIKDRESLATAEEKEAVSVALSDGLAYSPKGGHCNELGLSADGDYPQMRLGVFLEGELVGAWWIGCCTIEQENEEKVVISARPWVGFVVRNIDVFFNSEVLPQFMKYFSEVGLEEEGGRKILFSSLKYTYRKKDLDTHPDFAVMQSGANLCHHVEMSNVDIDVNGETFVEHEVICDHHLD